MLDGKTPCAISLVCLMFLATFAVMAGSLAADERADNAPLPVWDETDYWKYRWEDDDPGIYLLFGINYQNTQGQIINTHVIMTPITDIVQRYYSVTTIIIGAKDYKMHTQVDGWENGTWASLVTQSEDPNVTPGMTMDDGPYTGWTQGTGEMYLDMDSLNFKRGTSTEHVEYDANDDGDNMNTNDMSWELSWDSDVTESTSDHSSGVFEGRWKPNWNEDPIKVGDSWTQMNTYNLDIQRDLHWGNPWNQDESDSYTENDNYDFTYTVAAKSQKSVSVLGNTNTYADAFKIVRTGSFDFDWDSGTDSGSGTQPTGPYEFWYAGDGEPCDGGWGIEYNLTDKLICTSWEAFQNSPPSFSDTPDDPTPINEDELWEFPVVASDPDPGQDLVFTITAKHGTNSNVLDGLTIDSDGNIEFTPTQEDVADGYDVTINVSDDYEKNPMGIEFTFTLDVKNKNDQPTADSAVMVDFEMNEGEERQASFKMSDVFSDPDMGKSPLTDQIYDPDERLTYSVSNNGSIRVKCGSGPFAADLGPTSQCDQVYFEAVDGQFPRDLPVAMTITAIDKAGAKITDQVTVTVKHVNHPPTPTDLDEYEMDEDTTDTLDMKDLFQDIDVGNANYPTSDALTYDKDGEENMKITITGSKAKIEPEADWCGEEKVTFEASDKSGAKAENKVTILVNCIKDEPSIDSYSPDYEPEMDETDDGTEAGEPSKMTFSVVASDIDISMGASEVLTYNWSVEDGDNGEVFDDIDHKADFEFEVAFDGDLLDGAFHGGEGSKTYVVTCIVSDGHFDVKKEWYVTIKNVNRAPTVSGIEVSQLKADAIVSSVAQDPKGFYPFNFGKIYRLDATDHVTDLDEGIEDGFGTENIDALEFEWSSDRDGVLGTDPYIDVGAGKASTQGIKLSEGKLHTITLRVTDGDGASVEHVFTVKVGQQTEKGFIPGMGFMTFMVSLVVAATILALSQRKR